MEKQDIIAIATKVSEGSATSEEMAQYVRHIDSFITEYPDWENLTDEVQQAIGRQLHSDIYAHIHHRDETKRYKLWPRIAITAAAVAAITLGTWLYVNEIASSRNASRNDEVVMTDIKPGSVGATLTLANGQTIKLSSATNGELAKQAGVTITKTTDGQLVYEVKPSKGTPDDLGAINTLSTAKGETYQVKLPDGTAVWLNAASSLSYSASLIAHGKRVVRLSGEAYFQVAKDKAHPFIVESRGQQVEVLGTHFNINAYDDDPEIKTTLVEGSVRVVTTIGRGDILLKPGQQSVMKNQKFHVYEVDTEEMVAWKSGKFVFNEERLSSIMLKVARWYDVEVIYQDQSVKDLAFGGRVSRFENIHKVFEVLELTDLVHFKIEGRKIIVSK